MNVGQDEVILDNHIFCYKDTFHEESGESHLRLKIFTLQIDNGSSQHTITIVCNTEAYLMENGETVESF